ncbi:MAG TPA: signal recognition particle-docking protein FtsY, partial [Gemmatimonadales bacterium]|nr:signal recognition particle-docking protein FtsY [Gemmatimonadales bacterium]
PTPTPGPLSLWSSLRRLALTDVTVLVRGFGPAELDAFERVLIEADLGVAATMALVGEVKERVRRGELRTADDVHEALLAALQSMLADPSGRAPEEIRFAADGPSVLLVVGVNGTGKTTAIARLAKRLAGQGRRVLLCAADTYRAGAVQQLEQWANRLQLPCVRGQSGQDPAAVAFDAVEAASARGLDTVLVDTAGRLHTQADLMKELHKIARVVGRKAPGAPHETLLVLDGSTGQNAVQQGRVFASSLPLTGVIVTKLDGTARGGAVVAIRKELGLPIRFIGTGETADDLEVFDPENYARRLLDG